MPPATRKVCDYPGCDRGPGDAEGNPTPYVTEEGIPTRAEVVSDLMNHVKMAHELPNKAKESQAEATRAEAEKLRAEAEKLRAERPSGGGAELVEGTTERAGRGIVDKRAAIPRPEVDEGVTESDWSFFTAQWDRYKETTQLSGTTEAQHLWAACSTILQRSLHNAGAGKVTDPVELMTKVKELAVKKRNNLVNIIELQGMGQQHGEKMSTFIARLNGKAELCDYLVQCPGCSKDVSYKEKTVMYQLVRGIADKDMQERVLQAAAQVEGGELSLTRVVKLCEALEMSKLSQELVNNNNGSINRLYEYRQAKDGKKLQR